MKAPGGETGRRSNKDSGNNSRSAPISQSLTLAEVMAANPYLDYGGWVLPFNSWRRDYVAQRWRSQIRRTDWRETDRWELEDFRDRAPTIEELHAEYVIQHATDRERLAQAGTEFATAVAWLRCVEPTKHTYPRSPSSYHLKHRAERWGQENGLEPYVSNGVLIAAAVALGFRIERGPFYLGGPHSINCRVGVSLRSLRK